MEIFEKVQYSHEYLKIVLPLVLMVMDIATGYYNAWKTKKISSSKMRDGLGKKLAELVYIFVGMLIAFAFNMPAISVFISLYIVYMELTSIAENCEKLGLTMPDAIKEKLNNNEKGE